MTPNPSPSSIPMTTNKNTDKELPAPPVTESPLSFEDWWMGHETYDQTSYYAARDAWNAREPEIAQMREELEVAKSKIATQEALICTLRKQWEIDMSPLKGGV